MNIQVTKLRLRDGVNYSDVKVSKEQWSQRKHKAFAECGEQVTIEIEIDVIV
jgi:hypothetical protein